MKVIAFNGSARKDGNTAVLIRYVFEELEKEGIQTEMVQLAGEKTTDAEHVSLVSIKRTTDVYLTMTL